MVQNDQAGVRGHDPGAVRGHHRPSPTPVDAPLFELDPRGGQVVVTRFECRTIARLLLVLALHPRVKRAVRRRARGLVAIKPLVDWRHRVILSVSLWDDLDSVYSMGDVPEHVAASRLPRGIGVATACGIYCFVGDWKRVMFHSECAARSPLRPLER